MSLSVRIERHMTPFGDSDEDCNHADFFFSDGYMATAYHNEEHMITEYYKSPIDKELFELIISTIISDLTFVIIYEEQRH